MCRKVFRKQERDQKVQEKIVRFLLQLVISQMSNKKKRKWRACEIASKQERGQTLAGDTDVVRIEWTVRPYSLGSLNSLYPTATHWVWNVFFVLYIYIYIFFSTFQISIIVERDRERCYWEYTYYGKVTIDYACTNILLFSFPCLWEYWYNTCMHTLVFEIYNILYLMYNQSIYTLIF